MAKRKKKKNKISRKKCSKITNKKTNNVVHDNKTPIKNTSNKKKNNLKKCNKKSKVAKNLKNNSKIKNKKKKMITLILLIFILLTFIFSSIKIILWNIDNYNSNKTTNEVLEQVEVIEVKDEQNVEVIKQKNNKKDLYWKYIEMNLIDVDLKKLKKENNDTKGWIQVKGTNINYPFVQTNNNDYYLTHSFDKSYNQAGWVFLDYRNNLSKEEKNTIIYGHSRINKTMFGSLKNILTSDWLENTDNYIIKLSTEYENTMWQIFSIYHIPTTVDYLKVKFNNDKQFEDFSKMLLERSAYDFNTEISKTDRILTLSTCYNNNEKVVLHAKLIKRETK